LPVIYTVSSKTTALPKKFSTCGSRRIRTSSMENQAALKNTLLVALASALTALGWSASIENGEWLRVVGFPSLRTPEVRFSGAPSSPEVRFVWDGYNAKKPETMAARLAKFLEEAVAIRKADEAKRTVALHLNAAEKTILITALGLRREALFQERTLAFEPAIEALNIQIEAVSALLLKLAEAK
jgi:hypothetical protein